MYEKQKLVCRYRQLFSARIILSDSTLVFRAQKFFGILLIYIICTLPITNLSFRIRLKMVPISLLSALLSAVVAGVFLFPQSAFGRMITPSANLCSCSVMNSTSPADIQLEKQLQLGLHCDQDGEDKCKKLCVALAESTREDPDGKAKFCDFYKKDGRVYVHVFSKLCKRPYIFTGFLSRVPICCKNRKSIECN